MTFNRKWIEHDISDGRCLGCGMLLEGKGPICLRINTQDGSVDMKYQGRLAWATSCTKKEGT